jgi:hypothetical protein
MVDDGDPGDPGPLEQDAVSRHAVRAAKKTSRDLM